MRKLTDIKGSRWWIGIDGGGSGTQAVLSDGLEGRRLYAETGATNPNNHSEQELMERFSELLASLTRQAGIRPEDIEALCIGGAGIDTPADETRMRQLLGPLVPKAELFVHNDAYTALVGGVGGMNGGIIICGTGSIAMGLKDDQLFRVGGWGHLVGDEGSGWALGSGALREVLRIQDGRGEPSVLTERLAEHHALRTTDDILEFLYHRGNGKEHVASLARDVLDAAEAGDATAQKIVSNGVDGLLDLTGAIVRHTGNQTLNITYGGSLLIKSDYYRGLFENEVRLRHPGIQCHLPYGGPLVGALEVIYETLIKKERAL